MHDLHEDLLKMADALTAAIANSEDDDVAGILRDLEDAANAVGKAWSGSWLGYHSRVYYDKFRAPAAGDNFSPEWGLEESWPIQGTTGPWKEYEAERVRKVINDRAGNPSLEKAKRLAQRAQEAFAHTKPEAMSIITTALNDLDDKFIADIAQKIEQLHELDVVSFIEAWKPQGQLVSRDALAVHQGLHVPPHIRELAEVAALRDAFQKCSQLEKVLRQAGSHLARSARQKRRSEKIGTNVFIGHGRSLLWRELKDFVHDRLHLPWDEFNRVPVAGVTNIARLSEMLDSTAIAFLVMTAEDERKDGAVSARQNVIHEAGLFQGRLGFTRAIVVLEDGCEEFSNIQGLGQIRFPRGNIKAAFDEVRQVLEREGLIE